MSRGGYSASDGTRLHNLLSKTLPEFSQRRIKDFLGWETAFHSHTNTHTHTSLTELRRIQNETRVLFQP